MSFLKSLHYIKQQSKKIASLIVIAKDEEEEISHEVANGARKADFRAATVEDLADGKKCSTCAYFKRDEDYRGYCDMFKPDFFVAEEQMCDKWTDER